MARTICVIVFIVGCGIVALCIFLFGQCVEMANGNWSEETYTTQFVLYDVIQNEGRRSGINPGKIAGALYARVFLYALAGFVLIAISSWRLVRRMVSDSKPAKPVGESPFRQNEIT